MKNNKSNFNDLLVKEVSIFLQNYMHKNNIEILTADECALLLENYHILSNKIGPKPGFNFRQMLRDGRDGHINFVEGAYQKRPNTKWYINKKLI